MLDGSEELMRCRCTSGIRHSVGVGKALDPPAQTGETDETHRTQRAGGKKPGEQQGSRQNQQWVVVVVVGGGVQISVYSQTTVETRNRIGEMSSVI